MKTHKVHDCFLNKEPHSNLYVARCWCGWTSEAKPFFEAKELGEAHQEGMDLRSQGKI